MELTQEQKRNFAVSWHKHGLSLEQALKLRHRAQTDLYFLSKTLLGWDKMVASTHQEICDFFVVKNPELDFDVFCTRYDDVHDRLLLVPRGGFKSTIDVCDCVQWIIAYPDVTILILTGASNLAEGFVKELKGHFKLRDDNTPRLKNGKPSLFQILFPEHCYSGKGGNQDQFTTPARTDSTIKEPTVWAAGIDQNLSGWHFDIIKADDTVTNENSKTPQRLATVIRDFDTNLSMLNPGGFVDKIGTRYDENDLYGRDIRREAKAAELNEPALTKILLRSALWFKPEFVSEDLEDVIRNDEEQKVDLWFPERLSFKELRKLLKTRSWDTFALQYLNAPGLIKESKFTRARLVAATIPFTQLPHDGMVCIAFDTAYSTKNWADYSVGLAGLYSGGRLYVLDMMRGRYNEYELPAVMAAFINKWKPRRVGAEDSVGVKWLLREVRRELQKYRVTTTLEPINLGMGGKGNSKEMKAKPVVRLLGDKRLYFSNAITRLDDLYDELEAFPNKDHNDDIVSALTYLGTYFMGAAQMPQVGEDTFRGDRRLTDHIYGTQSQADPYAPSGKGVYHGLPPILGELGELE